MQMRSDPKTNTANERSFISFRASRPRTSPTVTLRPSDLGGVWGRKKAKTPSSAEQAAAMRSGAAWSSMAISPIIQPATIHPTVPYTRTAGNCFSGLAIWLKEMAFTRARVGL